MTNSTNTADYLDWQSELSAEQVFATSESLAYPKSYADGFIYLTQLKQEKSRSVLMFESGGKNHCLTPTGFDLRTRISEYGGKPFWIYDSRLYFVNSRDQCLYRQDLSINLLEGHPSVSASKPQRLSPVADKQKLYMLSDVREVTNNKLLMIVEQQHLQQANQENTSFIASLDISQSEQIFEVLISGADFYSNLSYHPNTASLAWVEWDHPSMPWDENRLGIATLSSESAGQAISSKINYIELGNQASACQLEFANNGRLFFSVDFANAQTKEQNYWNVYCFDFESSDVRAVTREELEFGYPHWQYGDARIVQYDPDHLLVIGSAPEGDQFFLIDQDTLATTAVGESQEHTLETLQNLSANGQGQAMAVRLSALTGAQIISIQGGKCEFAPLKSNAVAPIALAQAEHLNYPTRDKSTAHGFYYAPSNSAYRAHGTPPLIVLVHGGPTARAYGHLDMLKQFWTSRGFALLDVNHRGSNGYGRAYRDALYSVWGEIDTADIADGVHHLVEQGLADPQRICIRGKSAGGYAVLRALTEYPELFKAGACYYGIGNLATLAEVTHKFEKYYTDRLIDESYNAVTALLPNSKFYQRSPIYKLDQLKSAMIVFQGLEDKVVPPAVAREIVRVLDSANIDHQYVEYPNEAHGFKQVANNIDSLTKELAFYRRVLLNPN